MRCRRSNLRLEKPEFNERGEDLLKNLAFLPCWKSNNFPYFQHQMQFSPFPHQGLIEPIDENAAHHGNDLTTHTASTG